MKRDCQCPRARHEHGTWLSYANDQCKCQPCKTAWAEYMRAARKRRGYAQWTGPLQISLRSTALRLRALAVVGWSSNDLAPIIGTSPLVVREWRLERGDWMRPENVAKVAKVYDALWNLPPTGRYAVKVQRRAARDGWLAPLDLDDDVLAVLDKTPTGYATREDHIDHIDFPEVIDEIAVERAMKGDRVTLTKAEEVDAIAKLTSKGISANEIAHRLGRSSRTIVRKRVA